METLSALLAIYEGNPPVTGGLLEQIFRWIFLRNLDHVMQKSDRSSG